MWVVPFFFTKMHLLILCLDNTHRGGVMGQIGVWSNRIGIIFSLLATMVFADTDSPSFYGKRAVAPIENAPESPVLTFQRRSIVITPTQDPMLSEVAIKESVKTATISELNAKHSSSDSIERTTDFLPLIELSRNEKLLAKKAHYYFERNWNKSTGFTDSVQGYHHVTMWDVGSDISAQLSLEGLGLQSIELTNTKLERLLNTLLTMPLYQNKLPNREYNTKTGKPSGRYSKTNNNGNGWSALDIGRLLIWLHILTQEKPQLAPLVNDIIIAWSLASAVHDQTLYGTKLGSKGEYYRQEGRLGYLQYAAFGFSLFGFDVSASYEKKDVTQVNIDGILFYIDGRNMPFSTPDPYVLTRLELGDFTQWWEQLDTIYLLHKQKEKQTKRVWVFAEDAMNRTPWFAYNNLFFYGKSWLSTSSGGKPVEVFQTFSNKVALGLSVIYDDDYSKRLSERVVSNSLSYRSIPTGVYSDRSINTAYNINTNSMILSSLLYKMRNRTAMLPISIIRHNESKDLVGGSQENNE